ncbi:MAG: SDR family oxidoreductase [Gammaproteobacteria bacterium]
MSLSLKNKIVLVTGASSGIGEACAKIFAQNGAKLILCARREERIKKLAAEFKKQYNTMCHLLVLDVSKRDAVAQKISTLPNDWQNIDILVNNAGLAAGLDKIQDGNIDDWESMIDTNLKGLLYVTRAVMPNMIKHNAGHIINIGSIAGQEIYPKGNVYLATKHAVRALTKAFKVDLLGTNIRVSTVDPGMVETEFSIVRWKGDVERAKNFYADLQPLVAEDIADAVYYCASRPPHVNILELVVMPTAQSSATQVHRKGGASSDVFSK